MPATKKTKAKSTRKSTASKPRSISPSKSKPVHRWSAGVHTESTYPPKGLFTKDAATIARNLASKKTSPKGPASGMGMLNFYINRAGHNLSASRKKELEKAKSILSEIIARKRTRRNRRATYIPKPTAERRAVYSAVTRERVTMK